MFIVGSQRRAFTPEYKDKAVKLLISIGRLDDRRGALS